MPIDAPGSTAVVVPTPEAEQVVGAIYRANSKAGADGMTPHVTLLAPFVPAARFEESAERRLASVLGAAAPFDYTVRRFERFEGGLLYLAPEPADRFAALIESLWAEFPDYPPYEGIHDDVVPHLTVAEAADEGLVAAITRAVEPRLPLSCRASEATLVVRGDDLSWRLRARYAFRG